MQEELGMLFNRIHLLTREWSSYSAGLEEFFQPDEQSTRKSSPHNGSSEPRTMANQIIVQAEKGLLIIFTENWNWIPIDWLIFKQQSRWFLSALHLRSKPIKTANRAKDKVSLVLGFLWCFRLLSAFRLLWFLSECSCFPLFSHEMVLWIERSETYETLYCFTIINTRVIDEARLFVQLNVLWSSELRMPPTSASSIHPTASCFV